MRSSGTGWGPRLLRRLVAIGRDEQMGCISAVVLPQNLGMLRICEKLGFHTYYAEADRLIHAEAGTRRHGEVDGRVPGRVAPGDCSPGASSDPYLPFRT